MSEHVSFMLLYSPEVPGGLRAHGRGHAICHGGEGPKIRRAMKSIQYEANRWAAYPCTSNSNSSDHDYA
ncbi:hypothetical protein RSAG8_11362, partial [Rhizoctonia solani AG-8 WAC10335]